jgi:hypothetical protein
VLKANAIIYTKNIKKSAANINTIFGNPNILLLKCVISHKSFPDWCRMHPDWCRMHPD